MKRNENLSQNTHVHDPVAPPHNRTTTPPPPHAHTHQMFTP